MQNIMDSPGVPPPLMYAQILLVKAGFDNWAELELIQLIG